MAKNTSSTAFRKIDVDEFNEDNYKDEIVEEQINANLTINESEINSLMMQGKLSEALVVCLRNAPLNTKNQDIKNAALQIILRVLLQIKQSQMDDALSYLESNEQIDTLMKYIYRGFENPGDGSKSGHLLQWHEKVFNLGGIGCITRVLTDRKRV